MSRRRNRGRNHGKDDDSQTASWRALVRERLAGLDVDPTREAEIAEELADHLSDVYAEARAAGAAETEARRRALAELDDTDRVTRALDRLERARATAPFERLGAPAADGRGSLARDLWTDLRHAARLVGREPSFAAVAVLTLALGIGAASAMFSIVDAVMLRPLPYADADRVVRVSGVYKSRGRLGNSSYPDYLDLAARADTFASLGLVDYTTAAVTGAGVPARLRVARVTASMFDVLAVEPRLGRRFGEAEDRPDAPAVAMIAARVWRERFGADPGAVGRPIRVEDEPFTIVGVLPDDFRLPEALAANYDADLLLPVVPSASQRGRGIRRYEIYGRLRPGASVAEAGAQVGSIAEALAAEYPDTNEDDGAVARPLGEMIAGRSRPALLTLMGAVGLLLLIACANVANLLLARAAGRRREIAVRLALGASRGRVARQLVAESLLLATAAAGAGVLLAWVASAPLAAVLPADLPRLADVAVDGRVLAFAVAVGVLTSLVFGLAPALQASALDPQAGLRSDGRSVGRSGGAGWRAALVVTQVALTFVLLVGATLLARSLWRLVRVDPGFDTSNLLTAELRPSAERYREPADVARLYDSLVERVAALPGARIAAVGNYLPFTQAQSCDSLTVEGRAQEEADCAEYRIVSPNYFETLGVALARGRGFTTADREGAPPVALVNEVMARAFWPDADPVGQRVRMWWDKTSAREIVGVVGDVRHFGFASSPAPEIYFPLGQDPWPHFEKRLVVRTATDAAAFVPTLRAAVGAVDADLPLSDVRTMDAFVSASVASPRFRLTLVGAFGGLALTLALVGLYGLMAFLVGERTREIGVRMALGAGRTGVVRLFVGRGLRLTAVGLALGVAAALGATRLVGAWLFDTSPVEPAAFVAAAVLFAAVAAVAVLVPARRAASVDPMAALRAE